MGTSEENPQGMAARASFLRFRLRSAAVVALLPFVLTAAPARAGSNALGCALAYGTEGQIVGTAGDDTIMGTPHTDVIYGIAGNDVIWGRGGADIICAGPGNDRIFPGRSSGDRVDAGEGTNLVWDDNGVDVFSGDGDDTVFGARYADVGGGDDYVDSSSYFQAAELHGGPGDDILVGSNSVGGDAENRRRHHRRR